MLPPSRLAPCCNITIHLFTVIVLQQWSPCNHLFFIFSLLSDSNPRPRSRLRGQRAAALTSVLQPDKVYVQMRNAMNGPTGGTRRPREPAAGAKPVRRAPCTHPGAAGDEPCRSPAVNGSKWAADPRRSIRVVPRSDSPSLSGRSFCIFKERSVCHGR